MFGKGLTVGVVLTLLFLFCTDASFCGNFIKGVDLSALLEVEDSGGVFMEGGVPGDAVQILRDHGINYVRLRIWHSPAQGYNNLEKTLIMAERVKSLGLKFLLDFHYSDFWADPGKQTKPGAWEGLSFQELKDSVFQYTSDVIASLKNRGALPDMVQPGNEIICGMLWNEGRVCGEYDTDEQWAQFTQLVKGGIRGVKASLDSSDTVKIMIHIDRGGDNAGCQRFFDKLTTWDVNFDVIGLSYYPWWHGSPGDLENNIDDLAIRYGKEIVIVETAYPWTLNWSDDIHNIVGDSSQLLPEYPATVEGQRNFMSDLIQIIRDAPDGKGSGLFYWAPDWIATEQSGSPWENMTLFDFQGELLNSISAFDDSSQGVTQAAGIVNSFRLYQNFPNPFNSRTNINYDLKRDSKVSFKIYSLLGKEVCALVDEYQKAGSHCIRWDGKDSRREELSSGIYIYSLEANGEKAIKKLLLLR